MLADQVTEPLAFHGEGAVWDANVERIRWVDMLRGDVLTMDDRHAVERLHVGDIAAAIRPRVGGGLVVAVERGFRLVDRDGSIGPVHEAFQTPGVRMNEGACDRQGRFFCGSMAYDSTPGAGTVYRFDPDTSVSVVLDGVTISNGIAWSTDGGTVYYIDSARQSVDAFDFDAGLGRLSGRRTVAHIPAEDGVPDGLALDTEGGIWVAMWGGGEVRRYDVAGRLTEVVAVPVPMVTSCAFGGAGMTELYVTTSQQDAPSRQPSSDGALFLADVGVPGMPVAMFDG